MTTQTFRDSELVSPKADRVCCKHGASVQCRPTAPGQGTELLGLCLHVCRDGLRPGQAREDSQGQPRPGQAREDSQRQPRPGQAREDSQGQPRPGKAREDSQGQPRPGWARPERTHRDSPGQARPGQRGLTGTAQARPGQRGLTGTPLPDLLGPHGAGASLHRQLR